MSTRYEEIPLAKLAPHPENIRVDVGDVTELAASIESQGVLQPLVVAPHPTAKTKHVLLAGHRRLAAAKQVKLRTVPCVIREDLSDTGAQLETMLVENLQRRDLNYVEEAAAYQTLLDLPGYDAKRIANSTGRSQRLVKSRLKLNGLSKEAKVNIASGQLTLEQAEVLLEFADDEATAMELLEAADTPNWPHMVAKRRREREIAPKLEKIKAELKEAGAKKVPSDGLYSGKWSYTSQEGTAAEHVARGDHYALWEHDAAVGWYKPLAAGRPEPTEDEKAERKKLADFKASLQIAAEVRDQHLRRTVMQPPLEGPHKALVSMVKQRMHQAPRVAELIGLNAEVDPDIVFEQIPHLSNEQLIMILHVLDNTHLESDLLRPAEWDENSWRGQFTKRWIDDLTDVYEYELSDMEKEVQQHWKDAASTANEEAKAGGTDADH